MTVQVPIRTSTDLTEMVATHLLNAHAKPFTMKQARKLAAVAIERYSTRNAVQFDEATALRIAEAEISWWR